MSQKKCLGKYGEIEHEAHLTTQTVLRAPVGGRSSGCGGLIAPADAPQGRHLNGVPQELLIHLDPGKCAGPK